MKLVLGDVIVKYIMETEYVTNIFLLYVYIPDEKSSINHNIIHCTYFTLLKLYTQTKLVYSKIETKENDAAEKGRCSLKLLATKE